MPEALQFELDPAAAAIPKVDQYFGEWCIEPGKLQSLVEAFGQINLAQHVAQFDVAAARGRGFDVVGSGVAVVSLIGTLQKFDSSMGGTSTLRAGRAIDEAARDDAVKAIVVRIDSPGGTVAGTQQLADRVAAAKAKKPVVAVIEDLGASAAYWVASQAERIVVNATGLVGSIGTFAVVHDYSEAARQVGVQVHVIRAGEFKGVGVPGTEINDEHLADMQRIVDQLNSQFLTAVSKGRGMPIAKVRELADGRIHVGREAVKLGLADSVQTLEQTINQLSNRRSRRMSDSTNERAADEQVDQVEATQQPPVVAQVVPRPATLAELKAACEGAPSDFLVEQLEAGATAEAAGKAWMAQLAASNAQLAQDLKAAKAKKTGHAPVGTSAAAAAEAASDPAARIDELVAAKMKTGNLTRAQAVAKVCSENPDLREAWVEQHNATTRRRGRGETVKIG